VKKRLVPRGCVDFEKYLPPDVAIFGGG